MGVSLSGSSTAELTLPPDPATVGRARRAVRAALRETHDPDLRHAAELVVSELVTNAVVHAATEVRLRIAAEPGAIRVEIEDGNLHLPVRRTWSESAGTGRGLLIVDEHADRWSATRTGSGKVVWFEIGRPMAPLASTEPAPGPGPDTVRVTLLDVPLLMHWAWQEHAATLLREFLLHALDEDVHALSDHAAASDALSVLHEQLPVPRLPGDAEALMVSSVEPVVTADRVDLQVPTDAVRHFEVLDDVLTRAVAAAQEGLLLGLPTQPEIAEMRTWLCGEVAGQVRRARPVPWRGRSDVQVAVDQDPARGLVRRELAGSEETLIATNDASVIVAVTPSMVELLGYVDESDLLGRRVLVVIPERFHQAHIAGTTLHVTHGRDVLLDQWLTVPVVRADGTEVLVGMHVEARRLDEDVQCFLARVRPS